MIQRLQKYMAEKGIASRRKSEELISSGKVKVNGVVITEMGFKVDNEKDHVEVDGAESIPENQKRLYYMLNKPKGCVSTVNDQFNRPTVMDFVNCPVRLYPVGRLDYDTTGLIILTNDGDLTYALTHPKHNIEKTYEAKLSGKVKEEVVEAFKRGINIGGYITRPAQMEILALEVDYTLARIIIHEGKNRQVRRMCDSIGHRVLELNRAAVGKLTLGGLKAGEYRPLNQEEISYLKGLYR